MSAKMIRSAPWNGKMLKRGTKVPDDVPESVITAWVARGKAEIVKDKPKASGDAG